MHAFPVSCSEWPNKAVSLAALHDTQEKIVPVVGEASALLTPFSGLLGLAVIMSVCKACEEPLVFRPDPEEDDEEVGEVPDDLQLPCGCHFHW